MMDFVNPSLNGKKIFVGMSGGVDSAVSAALLKREGAMVTGVFIKGWYPPGMPCTWAQERRDAMRVAARLHIPFRTFDASAEYKKSVIDYLLEEYRVGRTPNPDVMCNREVKFGAFYRYAMEEGAEAIAMGHYRSGEKDQSYFLWAVPKDILAVTLFPVGEMEKNEVRTLAKKFNLPIAEKKDSQGICFLGSVSVEEFLKKELGNDNPALLYTIGQRAPLPNGPWFVVGKDVGKKEIKVSRTRKSDVHEVFFTDANWHSDPNEVACAQMRYRGPRCAGRVEGDRFVSSEPFHDLPTPGQSIVFYSPRYSSGGAGKGDESSSAYPLRRDKLVGGGIIA
ncbi:MAG: tRNA 2-thiouridine(34) synthase MnmA [Candidatus Kaiserbacteria bacterium]|nr:tRNA 2-thiouridine(34) synthase MnmA [Candidatus Kaiserbacteria bacterium]